MEANEHIKQLSERLEMLIEKQKSFIQEINILRQEVKKLQNATVQQNQEEETVLHKNIPEEKIHRHQITNFDKTEFIEKVKVFDSKLQKKKKNNIEEFIGENLIGKIGIIITVLGVALGAKYAIEKGMMGPLMRVISSYIFGLGLLGLAIKLKPKYENYSAVLLSGAMAILYFVSFTAYGFYGLIPRVPAFILMLLFTAFTVFSSISYNKQIIAHIGLVGAYTIPFLLSENKNQVHILFTYMSIINLGILVLSFKKYWKQLFYVAFGITWLIFFAWYADRFDYLSDFALAFTFLIIFFVLFYISFLAYKLLKKEIFDKGDILLLLTNAFIFYGFGYHILDQQAHNEPYLGLFTLMNAIVHFVVSMLVYRQKSADKNLFYFIMGLVLVFVSIAIPVQLDGKWVTMLWAGEAALFLWIGRSKQVALYENIALSLALLTMISLAHDWTSQYNNIGQGDNRFRLFANIYFVTSLLVAASYTFQIYINKKYASVQKFRSTLWPTLYQIIPVALLLITLYFSVTTEIINYYQQLFEITQVVINQEEELYPIYYYNYNLDEIKNIWIIIYSLFFFTVLSLLSLSRWKNKYLRLAAFFGGLLALAYFLSAGLWILSEMRDTYLHPEIDKYFPPGNAYLMLRYISIIMAAAILSAQFYLVRLHLKSQISNLSRIFDIMLYGAVLWILSSELLQWIAISNLSNNYKLGLSILWGVYSVFMIINGIRLNLKHLRFVAISLFAFTLIKLFLYDIADLSMPHKIVIFVSLGLLLLVISFLYTKYKHLIFDNEEENPQNIP